MNAKPMADRVLVKRKESMKQTASGFYIPEIASEKPDEGTVIAVGPGRKTSEGLVIAIDVNVGDKVLFGKGSGQQVKVDGEEFLVLKEDELFAVISE
jgi:chaperonin GroES